MPGFETLVVFTVAALVMNISPGPSNFYVMAQSVARGPAGGFVAAAGLATGSLVHVAAAALGLSAVFLYSPVAFTVVKFVGAAYLIYLGIQHFRTGAGNGSDIAETPVKPFRRIFLESIMVEALNPKTALFFLAFLPPFVDVAAGPPGPQILLLGLIVTATAIPCDGAVALAAGSTARLFLLNRTWRRFRDWVSGSVLVGLGIFIVLAKK